MISREAWVRVRVRVSVLPLIAMSVYCVLCERYDNRFAPQTRVRFSARVSVMTAYFLFHFISVFSVLQPMIGGSDNLSCDRLKVSRKARVRVRVSVLQF